MLQSSPCRRFSLLGIAHPVVGKYFQVLEVHRGLKHIQDLSCEKWQDYGLFMYFENFLDSYPVYVKFWAENPVSVYVMRKSCNKTHFCMIYAV